VILSVVPESPDTAMWTTENRPRYNRDRLCYPSDLTDEEWALVECARASAVAYGGLGHGVANGQ
jgi:hypothetical protein